jgi:hypothetical protein
MTMEELRRELAGPYRQDPARVEFIAGQVEAVGYCPFTLAGRQYVATAYLRRPGYAIQEAIPDGAMTRDDYDRLWDAVTAGEVEDHTPYGMGGDWCPFCGADWKREHDGGCESPYAR